MATASVTNSFVSATVISSSAMNTNFTDLVSFLNGSVVHVDGAKAMTGNLDLGSNKIVNLAAATANGNAVRYEQVALLSDIQGGTFTDTTERNSTTTGAWMTPFTATTITDPGRLVRVLVWASATIRCLANANLSNHAMLRVTIDGTASDYARMNFDAVNQRQEVSAFGIRRWTPTGNFNIDMEWQQTIGTAADMSIVRANYTYLILPDN